MALLDNIMAAGVVVMVVVVLGLVLGEFAVVSDDLVADVTDADHQSAINSTVDRGFNAINLLGISPIVLGGVAIIGILLGAFRFGGGGL